MHVDALFDMTAALLHVTNPTAYANHRQYVSNDDVETRFPRMAPQHRG